MLNQIDGKTKEERSKKLIELSNKNQEEYNKKLIGKKVQVLFEEKENELYKGHTTNYITVNVKSEEKLENQIKTLEITDTYDKIELLGKL